MTREKPPRHSTSIEEANALAYSRAGIRGLYTEEKWLPAEVSLVMDFSRDLVGRRVLEIGAGGGRIAAVLQERASEYLATDVSPEMVECLRRAHPSVDALVVDARSMNCIDDGRYDTVIFAFNGLDSISISDRSTVISEVFRVLSVGGVFIHSTHNVHFARSASYRPPLKLKVTSMWDLGVRLWNRARLKRLEYFSDEFALVNDRSLQNGLINTYVEPERHFGDLARAGFTVEATYNRKGRRFAQYEPPSDQWYYIVSRK